MLKIVGTDINTPQIIRDRANDTNSTNNKSFDNVDELLQYTSNTRRRRNHSTAKRQNTSSANRPGDPAPAWGRDGNERG